MDRSTMLLRILLALAVSFGLATPTLIRAEHTLEPPPACTDLWAPFEICTIGKGQSEINNLKVSMCISGNIVDPTSLGHKVHRIPVCAGTFVTVSIFDISGDFPTITAGGSLTCTGQVCTVTPFVTEKFKVVSGDGKDTDRMTLLPK